MKSDLQKCFRKLIDANFINYQGCLLEKSGDQWKALNKWYPSLVEAKKAVDKAYLNLNEVIKRSNQIKSTL